LEILQKDLRLKNILIEQAIGEPIIFGVLPELFDDLLGI
jgi:hypothetical protein